MTMAARSKFMPGEFNNYLFGGNVCNAFVAGAIGALDDFFLVGAEPGQESSYPLITGNILDSDGQLLCRLVRNVLVLNPGDCSKILGDSIGYEIHDGRGELILRVRTTFEGVPGMVDECFLTTLDGRFYDKMGTLVLDASSGALVVASKCAIGYASGTFGLVQGYSGEELEIARIALDTGGYVYEPMRGVIEDQEFQLDGKALLDAQVNRCKIHVATGKWFAARTAFSDTYVEFEGEAAAIVTLMQGIQDSFKDDPKGYVPPA
jgi:hypothetical protein